MKLREKIILAIVFVGWFAGLLTLLIQGNDVSILNPQGQVAEQQRNLLVFGVLLSLVIVLPVFALLFGIAWRYREGNKKAKYKPDWDHSKLLESIWWGVPLVLILILSIVTIKSSHDLDPAKPLKAEVQPVKIQVVALQWKWLFIYPDYDLATINYIQFPEKTPVNFEITADAPMNSFWIPSLGGQIYAMSGMSTKLHLMADKTGVYKGSSANISGRGFANMKFDAEAVTKSDFDNWVTAQKSQTSELDMETYNKLAEPTENLEKTSYIVVEPDLYEKILGKFMYDSKNHQEHMR